MDIVIMILEAFILASTLSLDAFIASFAYGCEKIKIPFSSVLVISLVCSGMLGITLFLGSLVRPYLSPHVGGLICFLTLFFIGLSKLLDNITKSIIRKHSGLKKDISFSLASFKFVLSIYANPEKADVDHSKSISFAEAFSLAAALSLDGMAAGFGAALGNINVWALLLSSLITSVAAVLLGAYIGNKIAGKLRFNVSWLSGAVLIVLAFARLR